MSCTQELRLTIINDGKCNQILNLFICIEKYIINLHNQNLKPLRSHLSVMQIQQFKGNKVTVRPKGTYIFYAGEIKNSDIIMISTSTIMRQSCIMVRIVQKTETGTKLAVFFPK